MAKKKTNRNKKLLKKLETLSVQNPNAAGIDVGSEEHWVAVRPDQNERPIRPFKSFTRDLNELADWLFDCGVTTVAMESTGVYWIPLFQILDERGFEVILVNSHHTKNVSGRKDDDSDSDWIRQLHSYGLLRGSFIPDDNTRALRAYLRDRETLCELASHHIQRIQKALTQMNIQLHHVISDITGKTGMNILRSIIAGERNPEVLASFRNKRIKADKQTIMKSLEGNYLKEHLSSLKRYIELYDFYQRKLKDLDNEIEELLKNFPKLENFTEYKKGMKRRKKRAKNAPSFDVETYIRQMTGVDMFAVDGLGANNILGLISETGLDMEKWKTGKHFTSWLQLSPNHKISGGKILSKRTRKTTNRANQLFRLAAQTMERNQSALGAFYRRMKYRVGAPKAIVATARKIALIYYKMLRYKVEYKDLGAEQYEIKHRANQIKYIEKKAQNLGFKIVKIDD